MIISSVGGKKIKIIILSVIIVLLSAGIYYYQKNFSKDAKPAYFLEVMTEKEEYARGEQVGFSITNKGTKPVWYLVPPAKCKSDFHWSLLFEEKGPWNIAYKYPKCEIKKDDYDLIEIKTLNPDESIKGNWDQKILSNETESRYAGSGKYKIVFYYSNEAINKADIKDGSGPDAKDAYSLEFQIRNDSYSESIKTKIQKENDAERKSDLVQIKNALGAHYRDNGGKYPLGNDLVRLNDRNSEVYKAMLKYIAEDGLSDPNHPEYYYGYNANGSGFELSARLENIEDNDCEMVAESLCIYKIDSSGNISQKKHKSRNVLTIGESLDSFFERLEILDSGNSTIMIISDLIGKDEEAIISKMQPPESIIVKKAIEVLPEDLAKNNLVLSGNPVTNSIIAKLNRKALIVDIADSIDIEKNDIMTTFEYSKNPWNEEKAVIIFETGYSMGALVRHKGVLRAEKVDEFYHIVFKSENGSEYAVVSGLDSNGTVPQNFLEYDGKNVEIYGYVRLRNSEEFPIENGLGVIDINILD